MGLPVGLDGSHVHPIAAERTGIDLVVQLEHVGDDIFAEVVARCLSPRVFLQPLPQHVGVEDVDAHGRQASDWAMRLHIGRLFLETHYPVILVHRQHTEAAHLLRLHPDSGYG